MVAGDVVPGNAIAVHVVEYCKAGLVRAVDVKLGVVRLLDLLVSGLTPGVETKTIGHLVRRGHLLTGSRPEPTINALGFKVATIFTTLEITQATARPDVRYVA